MAVTIASVRPLRREELKLRLERRRSESAVAYWEQKAAELGCRPTLAQLDLGAAIDNENWAHRFVIAPDPLAEVSTFLMCGPSAARLLELGESPLKYTVMFRKMPERSLEIFASGCRDAISSGSARLAGAVGRKDGGRELYRAVFIPVSVNLVLARSIVPCRTRRPDLFGKEATGSSTISFRSFAKSKWQGPARSARSPRRSMLAGFARDAGVAGPERRSATCCSADPSNVVSAL